MFDDPPELLRVVGDAAAGTAERERRADDRRETDVRLVLERFLEGMGQDRLRNFETDLGHRVAKQLPVLGHVNCFPGSGDQLDPVLFQHAFADQVQGAIESRLPAHRRQQGVRLFLGDDALQRLPIHRLDVHRVGRFGVGHDRRGIRVDENDAKTFVLQCLAGLCAGIVELTGLADHDRPGADDQDGLDVGALGHANQETGIWVINNIKKILLLIVLKALIK